MSNIRTFILLLVLINGGNLLGQTYQPILGSSNEWHQFFRGTDLDVCDFWKTNGDTMINSKLYKQIGTVPPSYYLIPLEGFVREDTLSRKVYYRNCYNSCDTNEILLYDFGKQPGDTVTVNQLYGAQPLKSLILDSIKIDTAFTQYRIFKLYAVEDINRFYPIIWVEGMGSVAGFESNLSEALSPSNFLGSVIISFFKDGFKRFQLPLSYDINSSNQDTCITNYVGVDELISNSIKLFPNPTTGKITVSISNSNYKVRDIYLTDMQGRLIAQTTETTLEIPTEAKRGMYFISVWFTNGQLIVRKILK